MRMVDAVDATWWCIRYIYIYVYIYILYVVYMLYIYICVHPHILYIYTWSANQCLTESPTAPWREHSACVGSEPETKDWNPTPPGVGLRKGIYICVLYYIYIYMLYIYIPGFIWYSSSSLGTISMAIFLSSRVTVAYCHHGNPSPKNHLSKGTVVSPSRDDGYQRLLHSYGKSPCLMGKLTINGHFQ